MNIPFGKDWHVNLAAGRYSWYPTDTLYGYGQNEVTEAWGINNYTYGHKESSLTGDPSNGYAAGTWTYMGADIYFAKGKWDFGVGYREFRGKDATIAQFGANSMGNTDKIKIASAGIGYKFSPAVGIKVDYSRVNAAEIADKPNQKHSYNVRLDWQATKKIGLYVSYKKMSNPGTLASTYDLQSFNTKGQKGWEVGTDITLQKNVSASAYYFQGNNLDSTAKLKMFYGNLNFSF